MFTAKSFSRRGLLFVLPAVFSIGILLATAASDSGRSIQDVFNNELYERMQAAEIVSLDDLSMDFDCRRFGILPVVPPDPEYILPEEAGAVAFDAKGFPKDFLDGLIPETGSGVPVYPIIVFENPLTRERSVLNSRNEEIARIAAPWDYDPFEYIYAAYPGAEWTSEYPGLKALYDPARITVGYRLVKDTDLVRYVIRSSLQEEAALKERKDKTGGGMVPMRAYSGPPVQHITFTAIERSNSCIVLTVAYPWVYGQPTNSYTNRLEFFGCTNLIDFWWSSLATTNVNSSTNWMEWKDSEFVPLRFYAAGNADLDSDSDALADAREHYLYHSSPSNADTDADSLSDYEEVINLNTDPCNSDTGKPLAVISYPTNNFTWVWMP